tara:strand:- start:5 stop:139 length:135 start_codon:yes stop_codon:yes gene_type:complete
MDPGKKRFSSTRRLADYEENVSTNDATGGEVGEGNTHTRWSEIR